MTVQKRNETLSRGGTRAKALLGVVVGLIAVLTLWPLAGSAGPGGIWCFGCGSIGTLDLVNNLLLFAPLGVILAARDWRLSRAMAAGLLFSGAIEGLQFIAIPGRDASPSDLVMNTLGTAAGWIAWARAGQWLRPSPAAGRWWTVAAGVVFAGVLAGTGWLLLPSTPPEPLFGQWAPRRPPMTQYRGRIVSFEIAGHEVPHSPVPDANALRAAIGRRQAVALIETVTGTPPDAPGAMIGRLVAIDNEMFMLAQRGDALLGRFRLRASDLRLRTLSLMVPASFRPDERVRVEGGYDGSSLVLRVVRPDGVIARALPLRVSLGWAFVRPAEIPLGAWHPWVSALWVGLLGLPLGFYGASAAQPAGRQQGWSWLFAVSVAAAAVVAGLGGAAWLTAAAPSTWTDWAGAALGVFAGWQLRRLIDRSEASAGRAGVAATAGPGRA